MKNELKDFLIGLLIIVFFIVAFTSIIFIIYALLSPESKKFLQIVGYVFLFMCVILFVMYIAEKIHKTIGFFIIASSSICALLLHNSIIAIVLFMFGFIIIISSSANKK